ncbi:MAG: ribose-5-phosphate isomerase RpiA [Verrucomicrobiota bacterium]|nr:ribose-5-phosphate isomerase RpiA [Verrucomicrobiota bacterium]
MIAKRAAAKRAAEWIERGMIVGLGSGTTAAFFIEELIQRRHNGLECSAVASSKASADLALAGGIPLLDLSAVSSVDITVDGADEIDPQKRMIKGRGGAHVQEKILASSSQKMVVIIDTTKCVAKLGKTPLPVEILRYGAERTKDKLQERGFKGVWRKEDGQVFITENGNLLLDINFPHLLESPEAIEEAIQQIPGVVDTGFFFHLAGPVIIGNSEGSVEVIP